MKRNKYQLFVKIDGRLYALKRPEYLEEWLLNDWLHLYVNSNFDKSGRYFVEITGDSIEMITLSEFVSNFVDKDSEILYIKTWAKTRKIKCNKEIYRNESHQNQHRES